MELNIIVSDLSIIIVSLIANQDNRNIWSDSGQISVPLWHIPVCHSRSQIEHDDGTVSFEAESEEPTSINL